MRLSYSSHRITGFLYLPAIYLIYTLLWVGKELYDLVLIWRDQTGDIPGQILSVYVWIVITHLLLTVIACLLFFKKKRGTVSYMVFFLFVKTGLTFLTLTYNLPLVIVNGAICLILMGYFLSSSTPRRVFNR